MPGPSGPSCRQEWLLQALTHAAHAMRNIVEHVCAGLPTISTWIKSKDNAAETVTTDMEASCQSRRTPCTQGLGLTAESVSLESLKTIAAAYMSE